MTANPDGARLLARIDAANTRFSTCRHDRPLVFTMNPDDPLTVGDLREVAAALRAAPARCDAGNVEANLRQRQLEHGKKRPEQNNPDGYPDKIPATPPALPAGEEK